MENIKFEVSAKTARLLGRENISDVDSAVIELIKNSYDADATCVFIGFFMPFPSVPTEIKFELVTKVFDNKELALLLEYYQRTQYAFIKKKSLSPNSDSQLEQFLFSKNRIVVMDNGHGMDAGTLRSAWMNIGTSDKEIQQISPGGRVKTGAKGIGRFALDKLSTQTVVYSKNPGDTLLRWAIDWNQFESASLLGEVNATLERAVGGFADIASQIAKENVKSFGEYEWESGTAIILQPTREIWSEYYFDKINKNLRSIFPDRKDSQFDIYVYNQFYPKFSSSNERFSLQDSEYDYRIALTFNGVDNLKVTLFRNEVDTRKIKAKHISGGMEYNIPLADFWTRAAFEKSGYRRTDYARDITKEYSKEMLKMSSEELAEIGPFSADMYFLKNTNSTVDIIKPIVVARRKEILNNYSGIKLYRDGFKVRPYGEEGAGSAFDWLKLGVRAQKSPAAVSHQDGSWRVMPYQLTGAVRISRANNPNLVDMANREGLAINNAYTNLLSLLIVAVAAFESDRQYVYREYASWIKQKETELSTASKVIQSVITREENSRTNASLNGEVSKEASSTSHGEYSDQEYEQAIIHLETEKERQQRAMQTMMLFSSAGVMTNTFSHEISRIATNAGTRMQHIRACVQLLIGKDGYIGDPDFNPLALIEDAEKTDMLLESWINVIMKGIDNSKFQKTSIQPQTVIREIIDMWVPLLEKKFITIMPLELIDITDSSMLNLAEIDIYIIMNNFLLNSSWFLEKAEADHRTIWITIKDTGGKMVISLENNGPQLDISLRNNPESIFEAGVSTKKLYNGEGTGLGLWITKMVVDNNSGEIHPITKDNGFGLEVTLPK